MKTKFFNQHITRPIKETITENELEKDIYLHYIKCDFSFQQVSFKCDFSLTFFSNLKNFLICPLLYFFNIPDQFIY